MMVDRFTKWVEIAAVKGKDMSKAVDKFEKRIVARWGAPATVMADNVFKGKFAEMCAKYGVNLKEMIPHQHNSTGLANEHLLGSMVQQVPCGTGGHGFNSHG